MKPSFIWSLSDDCGSVLSFRATEKEIRADRKWWREHGMRGMTVEKVKFTMNRVGIAKLLTRYGVRG